MFERSAKNFFHLGWGHGRYFDFWSFVHILTGVILGLGALIFSLRPGAALIAIAVALTLYEGLEIASHVAEDLQNVVSDIVLGTLSAALVIYWLGNIISYNSLFLVLAAAIAVNLLLLRRGWHNYLKRKAGSQEMQARGRHIFYFISVFGAATALFSLGYWWVKTF